MSRVARRDISRLQPAVTLSDGRVRAEAHLTRCGIFTYAQPDGTTRRELRPAEEVFRPDSLNSFAQVPVTDDHPPEMLNSKNARKYAVGAVGDSIIRDEDHVRGKLGVFDADVIAKMRAGKLDVSCGYTCDLEEKPGVDPVYGKYDAIQRNIVGNHLAIVDRGRAGSAKVRMDGMTTHVDYSNHADSRTMENKKDGFDPDEPRGSDGKWGDGNASRAARTIGFGDGQISKAESAARSATDKANKSGKFSDHVAAYDAHRKAVEAIRVANSGGQFGNAGKEHANQAEAHHQAAIKAATPGDEAALNEFRQRVAAQQTLSKASHSDSSGTKFALGKKRAKLPITDMADSSVAAPLDIDSEQPSCDPDDLATRSKKKGTGTTGVKAAEAVNDSAETDPDDDPEDEGEEGDEEDAPDPYESSSMDAADQEPDGDPDDALPAPPVQDDADRIAAHTYAVPSKKKIPIHSPDATKTAMDNFGNHKFAGPDEKHAAFNRVYQKAIQFGIPRDQRHAFQDTHGSKLDRADHKDKMIELKKAQDALAAAVKRADAAEQKLAKAEGQIVTLKQDAADKEKARKDADDGVQARMDAKIDLLVRARATGAAVDTSMTPRQIHCAVVKHVRKLDIADDKHDAYAEALFDGAMEHAKTDALETLVGGAALASVRKTVEEIRTDASDKTDAAPNESEAARRLNERTTTQWMQPARKEIK